MSELLKLAERCEAAMGPDRELDAAIAIANGSKAVTSYGDPALGNFYRAPAYFKPYTASLDAAMTLVPEGWDGGLYLATDTHKPEVQLETPAMRLAFSTDEEHAEGSAVTLPLALCAAALRARDALTNSEGGGE